MRGTFIKEKDYSTDYFFQLDFLRAIAVLLVIVSHWYSKDFFLNRYTENDTLGVTMFFVLSGFLITGILLKSKNALGKSQSLGGILKVFYVRRALRIFPVYYLLLLLLVTLGIDETRDTFWWHFFYGSNFLFWIKGHFVGLLSPFWSLSVEEQFYLIWPFVILLAGQKKLPYLFCLIAASSVLFRFFIATDVTQIGRILMPGSLDSFCVGGLIAFGRLYQPKWYACIQKNKGSLLFLAVIMLVFVNTHFFNSISIKFSVAIYYLILSIAFAILTDRLASGINSKPFVLVLNNPVFLFLGKISYGLYLFHSFIPKVYGLPIPKFLTPFSFYIAEITRFSILILIASISWYFFEKPILKFKKYFFYQDSQIISSRKAIDKLNMPNTI
ncbi:MAG: acyltransferase [Chitinophagaceae bacterium]|jgi:peptidoglycan/LPS O-acetylase OafA/YrhL|nr:acyltransferase [Chitinophagaceae bacterium]